VAIVVTACACAPITSDRRSPVASDPGIDLACLRRAQDGELQGELPAELAGFRVTAISRGVHLHRDGRPIVDRAEETRLMDRYVPAAVASGGTESARFHSSCPDADQGSCIKTSLWVCRRSVASYATWLAGVTENVGLGDVGLSVDVEFAEAQGPTCRQGPACTPVALHSSRHYRYDPDLGRKPVDQRRAWGLSSWGTCADDGDCEKDGNKCVTWYLRGGWSDLLYVEEHAPTFCGCVEHRCTWFQQPRWPWFHESRS
jgi:hypothetical protein